jgi:hypothetical protein
MHVNLQATCEGHFQGGRWCRCALTLSALNLAAAGKGDVSELQREGRTSYQDKLDLGTFEGVGRKWKG